MIVDYLGVHWTMQAEAVGGGPGWPASAEWALDGDPVPYDVDQWDVPYPFTVDGARAWYELEGADLLAEIAGEAAKDERDYDPDD